MNIIRPSDEYLQEPYWRHLAAGSLHLNCCNDCGSCHHPPSPICPQCRSFNTGWKPASGRATLNSFAEARHPVHPLLEPLVPYMITLVDLEEGVRLVSGLPPGIECDLVVGMPLVCKVIQYDEEFALPYFVPVGMDDA